MKISKIGENFVLNELNKNKKRVYTFHSRNEYGFDIRDEKSNHFIEVKSTSKKI